MTDRVVDQPPDLQLLTGAHTGEMLATALAVAGGTVISWRTRDISYQLRTGSTASYRVDVGWADGTRTTEILGACTGQLPVEALAVERGDARAAVWRVPNDPDLPGLALASDPRLVGPLLEDLGIDRGPVRLVTRAYRPRRRAVIEAIGGNGRVFIKVVRPSRIEALHDRHRQLVASGLPAPQSLGWHADGLLVLEALSGETLRASLLRGAAPIPAASTITAMLDRIPTDVVEQADGVGSGSRSWLQRVRHYAAVVAAALPAEADRAIRLAAEIDAEAGTGPVTAVHGDLYDSQILIAGGQISGLLDIDTIRLGDRLDDLGCLLGHLSVLSTIDRRRSSSINRVGAEYITVFDQTVQRADLRYRAAAVVMSLATGPHRVQEPLWASRTTQLLDLCARWLASARRAAAR